MKPLTAMKKSDIENFTEFVAVHAEVEDIVGWAQSIMSALGAPDQHVNDIEVAFARQIIRTDKQIKSHQSKQKSD